jgi:hypothetical protein
MKTETTINSVMKEKDISISSLDVGDWFTYIGKLYLKVEHQNKDCNVVCFNFNDKRIAFFILSDLVVPCDRVNINYCVEA